MAAMRKTSPAATSFTLGNINIENSVLLTLIVVLLCGFVPLDLPQLVFAALGAFSYAFLQLSVPVSKDGKKAKSGEQQPTRPQRSASSTDSADARGFAAARRQFMKQNKALSPIGDHDRNKKARQESAQPAVAPTFDSVGFDAQVDELLEQIVPTQQNERVVSHIAGLVQTALQKTMPEATVLSAASSNVLAGVAFGVAVPEVDIIAVVPEATLSSNLNIYTADNVSPQLHSHRLQKAAIRTFTDCLVAQQICKFRRSGFKSRDPKVTLLVPSCEGAFGKAVPIDFQVNCATPVYHAALLVECGRIDPRARALALLVRRWAKDRGISHAAKGHLSPYAWTLLVVYFLQVRGAQQEGPMLPPMARFVQELVNVPLASIAAKATLPLDLDLAPAEGKATVADLFKDFFLFYRQEMDFKRETVVVRLGRRNVPPLQSEVRSARRSDGSAIAMPVVLDPFENNHSVSAETTAEAMQRFREELQRACSLCAQDASVTELLEPWRPDDIAESMQTR